MVAEAATPVVAGAGGVLEGEAAAAEAVCMAHQVDLHRAWGDLSQASNCILLKTSERDGTKTPAKRVLTAHHQGAHAET